MDLQEHISALTADTAAAHLGGLDDETLAGLQAELESLFRAMRAGEVEGTDKDDLDALNEVASAIRTVRAEGTRRSDAVAEAESAALARAEEAAQLEADLLAEIPAEADVEPEGEPETDEPAEPAPEKELVSAAAKPKVSLAQLAAARKPAEAAPRAAAVSTPRWQLTDGTKADFDDKIGLAERIIEAQSQFLGARNGISDKLYVAKFKVDFPEEMRLSRMAHAETNQRRLEAITDKATDRRHLADPEVQAIVASGGWCAPLPSRYDIPSTSGSERPVRDGLARVGAERGGVSYVRAARLSTIAASDTIWENATDTTPGENTKARLTAVCRTVRDEELGAIVYRMRFGNFQSRAFPEDVAHDIELAQANHARVAEVRLLDALIADVNIDITQTGLLGTSRDAKHHLMQAAAELAYTERSRRPVRAIVSDVLPKQMAADVVFQQASGETMSLFFSEADARRMLDTSGLLFTYSFDVPTGSDAFVVNSDNENLADWPDNFEIPVFFDGQAVFLDGGELNLGIVRDGTLNNTNDYEVFFESFEGLIWIGPYAKTLTLTTCPGGDSQVALDNTATLCTGS